MTTLPIATDSTLGLSTSTAVASTPLAAASSSATATNAALAAFVQQLVAQLDAAEATFGSDPPMTPSEKRHAAKLRKGGESVVAQLANLAQQHQLESPALHVATMQGLIGRAQALTPLLNRLDAFVKHVGDLVFQAESGAWVEALQFYALLQRRARTDSELATSLAPVTQFMAYKRVAPAQPGAPRTPTRAQQRAIQRAVAALKKTAPAMLAAPAGT